MLKWHLSKWLVWQKVMHSCSLDKLSWWYRYGPNSNCDTLAKGRVSGELYFLSKPINQSISFQLSWIFMIVWLVTYWVVFSGFQFYQGMISKCFHNWSNLQSSTCCVWKRHNDTLLPSGMRIAHSSDPYPQRLLSRVKIWVQTNFQQISLIWGSFYPVNIMTPSRHGYVSNFMVDKIINQSSHFRFSWVNVQSGCCFQSWWSSWRHFVSKMTLGDLKSKEVTWGTL